jgi:hypothetical protein
MREHKYIEGPEAFANFEQLARAVLQAPRPKIKARKRPKAATSRKSKKADRG